MTSDNSQNSKQFARVIEGTESIARASRANVECEQVNGEVTLRVSPNKSTKNASAVIVHIDRGAGKIYLAFGQDTTFAIGLESTERYTEMSLSSEALAILEAILTGKAREELWYKDGRLVKSKGWVELDFESIATTARHIGSTLFMNGAKKKRIEYDKYT